MLSTRRDLLPADIADELAKLQDRVPPFPSEQVHGDAAARLSASRSSRFSSPSTATRRQRVGRAGALGRASRRHAGRGEGAAAEHRGDHREGSRPDADGRGAGGEAMVRRQAAAPARSRRRIRQDHPRRTRSGAGSRQLLAAAPQLPALAAAAGARGLLGLVHERSDGHGAHDGNADRPDRPAEGARHRHPAACPRRRRDLFHAGVSRRLFPRRHAPGQHLRRHRSRRQGQVHRARFRHHGHALRARQELPGAEFPRIFPPRLSPRRDRAHRVGLGARRTRASTSWKARFASCSSRSSTSRSRKSRSARYW